jgi:SAM-dependent methyltransferase
MIRKLKKLIANVIDRLVPSESLAASKKKWNRLGRKNPRYFVWTTKGENITEAELDASGEQDYERFVADDRFLRESFGDVSGLRALEVGCGIGRMTKYFARDFLRVDGTDISDELIRVGKERMKALPNVILTTTDGQAYPFSDGLFDVVFSYLVFQHMSDTVTVETNLREVARVLKPGGIAKIQLRGIPIRKYAWSYGVYFDTAGAHALARRAGLMIVHEEGNGEKNYWLWLKHL